MDSKRQLNSPAVDLLAPSDRFASAGRLYGRLHRWWLLLSRYWWVVVVIVVLVLAPTYLLTAISAPKYESDARMWLTGRLNIREGQLYTEELINYLGTQVELLRSPAVQRRAFDRMREQFNEAPAALDEAGGTGSKILHAVKAVWSRLFASSSTTSSNAPPPVPFDVKVVEGSKSSTLELQAVGSEPASTQAFLDCLMREYLEFKKESRENASSRASESLGTEVAQLKSQLDAQQTRLHAFQASNNVVFLQEQGNSAASYLASLNKRLAVLHTELRLLKTLRPEQWIEMKNSPDPLTGESLPDETAAKDALAGMAGPQQELFKATQQMQLLKARREELLRYLRPEHPKIIKLNEDIKTQEKLVQISRDEALKQMEHRKQAIEMQIQNLEAACKEWDAKALAASRKIADYEQIRQELQRLQGEYDKTLALIQTVDVSKKVEQENVGILDPASAATPVHRKFRNMAIALAGALLLSFGLLYCLALFQDDFASLEELAHQLSEEVLGQIPAISINQPRGRLGIEALEKQRFEFLEAFRSIRSALLFMNNGAARPKTIVVASSVPEEGKSTVALYLAATLARGNSRVLLVDGDMRRAALHKFFGASAGPGLAEMLNQEISPEEAIVPTGMKNLSFLPAGEPGRNPGELVLSPAWTDFLREARPQFDFILVDTPPVLATDDAATLAPGADGVLFVVRGSFTSARMARVALNVLRRRRARVAGLVFNRAVPSPCEPPYYRYYADAYQWRPEKPEPRQIAGVGQTYKEQSVGAME